MFWNTTKIFEALATIKADTKNHKEDMQEMKETFSRHIDKEDKQQIETQKKMEDIHCKLSDLDRPYDDRIQKLEDRYVKIQKDKAKELIAAAEKEAKEIKERAGVDKEVAEKIASLRSRSKYNLLSMAGIWTVLGIILRKIFTS